MSVEQAVPTETGFTGREHPRRDGRGFGLIAVGLALLSAFVTFIVLADLTPIVPTHYVVVTLLLTNAATGLLLARHHRPRGLAGGAVAPRRAAPAPVFTFASSGCFRSSPRRRRSWWRSSPASRSTVASTVCSRRAHSAALQNSLIVAEAYLRDHAQIVRSDIMVMAYNVRAQQAGVRQRSRKAAAVPDLPGLGARPRRSDRARQKPQGRRARASADQPDLRHAAARGACAHRRKGTANRSAAGHQLRRRRGQAARIRRLLSLRRAAARPAVVPTVAGDDAKA